MNGHINLAVGAALAAAISSFAPSAASALSMTPKGTISHATVEQIGLIYDDWRRCWRTAPPYYGGGWGPQPYRGWNGVGWRGEGWHGHHEDHDD